MDTYLPFYSRPPNKLLRYEKRSFEDRSGHKGIELVAIYHDKNGKQKEETARVYWERKWKE